MEQIIDGIRSDFCEASGLRLVCYILSFALTGAFVYSVLLGFIFRNEKTYKEGWIDCKNGVDAYRLKKKENGETVWEENDLEDNLIERI